MAKYHAHGASVTIGGTAIGGMATIGLPDETRGEVEVTDHDSGGDREYLPGLRDAGSVTLEGRHDPEDTGQVALRTNYNGSASAQVVITLPGASATTSPVTYTFDAFVTALGGELAGDGDDPGNFSATLKVDGAVTFDVGT